ncbi:endonuclease/exonuclease/phosphatase family protein [Viscerimonas tarda]
MPVTSKINIARFSGYIVFAANVVAMLFLFMACLSWYVSPEKMIVFAYAGLAFPFILAINVAFVVFWLICRKWRFLLVAVAALLLCIKPVTTYFPLNVGKKEFPEGSIKFLSYNVMAFKWHEDLNKPNEDNQVIEYIRNSGADIVCIQEYVALKNLSKANMKNIHKRLKNYPYYSVVNLRPEEKAYTYGVACFSKYPIISSKDIPYESDNGSALFKLNINGKIIAVVNNHLESNGLTEEDRELYNKFLKETSSVKIDDIANNIRQRLGHAFRKRASQAETLEACIKEQDADGMIVCGDFNDTPISYAYHKLKGDLIDSYVENEFGPRITYHENHFWFKIDFILHSSNIKSYNCTIDKVKYSDHYPVWAYLKIE